MPRQPSNSRIRPVSCPANPCSDPLLPSCDGDSFSKYPIVPRFVLRFVPRFVLPLVLRFVQRSATDQGKNSLPIISVRGRLHQTGSKIALLTGNCHSSSHLKYFLYCF
jgi:hypothetical protein